MSAKFGVTGYDDANKMFEDIRRQQQTLDEQVVEWQKAIKPGNHAFMQFEAMGDSFPIFYEIIQPGPGDHLAENCRLVRGYSIAEPDGEYGTVHVANLDAPMTSEQFEQVKSAGWAVTVTVG